MVVSGQKRDQATSSSGIVSKTLISIAEADPIIDVMLTLNLFAENLGTWSEGLFQKTWFKFPIGQEGYPQISMKDALNRLQNFSA